LTADPSSSGIEETVVLGPLEESAAEDAWQTLSDTAIDPNPFFGPAFLRPFLEHMSYGAVRLLVVRERTTGRWLAAAPIGRRRPGLIVPTTTIWTTDYSPLGTPLVHPEAGDGVLQAFLEAGAGRGGVFAVPYLPLHSKTATRLMAVADGNGALVARSARASHGAEAKGAAQLADADSGKRRKERRRLLRRLGDHGKVRFSSHEGTAAGQAFEAFLHLEAGGWKGRSGTALLNLPETAAFARAAVANRARAGGVRIDQLWAGSALVAALVLFREGGRIYSWKIAFDEDYARYSPGAQVALQAFRTNLASPGFKGADSLAIPGHAMIEPLWRGRLETGTLLYARGPIGGLKRRLCAADVSMEQRLRRAARALRKRLSP
jgi:CelD/BcsL family acetyltransferase involved in cellulose biosynthesis